MHAMFFSGAQMRNVTVLAAAFQKLKVHGRRAPDVRLD